MSTTCPTCGQTIPGTAPQYPVECKRCGIKYGDGGEVANHRPDGDACRERQRIIAAKEKLP